MGNKMKEFIPSKPLETAVLFLIFNRLNTTKRVFEAIKKAKPPRIYIASDGPRDNIKGENEIVLEVRNYVLSNIDWNCEVKTLFRDKNLGCKYAVSSAISWFFENEKQGIILEDDCLPSQSFFWFCEELLNKYKDDMRIWHIGGYKHPYLKGDIFSYNFSRFTQIWGWASWSNRWKYYDVSLSLFRKYKNLLFDYEFFLKNYENISRFKILQKLLEGKIDTWDYQWNFTVRVNSGLAIRPSVNLVRNIGFGIDATHTSLGNKEIEENVEKDIDFPLKHPEFIMVYKKDDEIYSKKNLDNSLFGKIKKKFFKSL